MELRLFAVACCQGRLVLFKMQKKFNRIVYATPVVACSRLSKLQLFLKLRHTKLACATAGLVTRDLDRELDIIYIGDLDCLRV